MTNKDVYKKGKSILKECGIDNSSFEVMEIFKHCFEMNRQKLIINGSECADKHREEMFFNLINERTKRIPLQYIIGEWEFMDIKLKVGKGVLIPREDTQTLVRAAALYIKNIDSPKILDLCAGSGAISIELAKLFPTSEVYAVELSDEAIGYLYENIRLNNVCNVNVIKADILKGPGVNIIKEFDIIVSNPPYIKTEEISTLQEEVRFEPYMALNGGKDGLMFYRSIMKDWLNRLKTNGILAVEIGSDQAKDVCTLFNEYGLRLKGKYKDLSGLDRALVALKI